MARKFYANIDLNGNQLKNVLVDVVSSDPGSPAAGQVWFNSTSHLLKWYDGTTVQTVGSGAAGPTIQTIAYAATITPVGSNIKSICNVAAMTGAMTIASPSGSPADGNELILRLIQDGTGGRVITWNAIFAFGTDITKTLIPLAISAKWEMKFIYNATDSTWRCVALVRGF